MDFEGEWHAAATAVSAFLDASRAGEGRVLHQPPLAELAARLDAEALIARGGLTGEAFQAFLREYLGSTTRLHHPGFLAHQVAPAHPMGAAAALIDAGTNNAMAIYEMGPAAATLEFVVLRWMLAKAGWAPPPLPPGRPEPGVHGAGVLTHGGSLANLTALLAARGRAAPESFRDGVPSDLVLVAPRAAHYSIARAAGLLGLGGRAVVDAPADADGRVRPDGFPALLRRLADQGKRVMAVVASACSTAVGLHDPLRELGQLCREHGLWLHVDGAHGASALLSSKLRGRLDGLELADSLVWDAHKMLRTPTLCAAVLVRDGRDLDRAFQQEASYLLHEKDEPGFDFMSRTVECTKAGLGLKVFLTLASEGEGAIARYVERQYALATLAAARLRREPGVEVAVEPEANIVCFRYTGSDADQLELRRRLLEGGRSYLSSTEFRGQRWLRLALMSPATTPQVIDDLLAELAALRSGA